MTRLVDDQGNQVLPDVGNENTKITGWVAVQCLSADHRARVPVFWNVAAHLHPTEDE